MNVVEWRKQRNDQHNTYSCVQLIEASPGSGQVEGHQYRKGGGASGVVEKGAGRKA